MTARTAARHLSSVGDGSAPERRDGIWILQGEREWHFRGSSEEAGALREALPGMHVPLTEDSLILRFGNRVGSLDLPGLGKVEIVAGKWDETHFHRMLEELTQICVNLPFAASKSPALPYDRSVVHEEDVRYHAFVYLRHVLSELPMHEDRLHTALELVLRDPHRRWHGVDRAVPLDQVRRVGPATLLALARSGGGRPGYLRASRLPPEIEAQFGGDLPATVPERRPRYDLDTPENRFVKAFLDQAIGILDQVALRGRERGGAFAGRLSGEASAMARLLCPIRTHPFWREVGPMTHLPSGSTVLQRRRGYRHILRHFSRLRLAARVPLDPGDAQSLLEGKDIALLYELWTFFKVVELAKVVLGEPSSAIRPRRDDFEVALPHEFEVRWPGVTITFNPRFSRARSKRRQSYSTPLRPDIGLEVGRGRDRKLHLLDAKFRVQKLWTETADEDEPADVREEERRGTFKRGDLYKMHTYRDAIPGARSVWILYPGTEFKFFSAEDPASGAGWNGVGAAPMIPGAEPAEFAAVLEELLGKSTEPTGPNGKSR
jgi:predicted component of viral defense system (DUF524 family)